MASGLDINGFTELFWGDSKFALLYKLYTLPGHGLLVCPWQTFVRQLAGPRRPHLPGSITWMFRPCRPGFYLLKVAHTYPGGLFLRQGLILQDALGPITQVISCAVQIVISSVLSHENILNIYKNVSGVLTSVSYCTFYVDIREQFKIFYQCILKISLSIASSDWSM